MKPDGEVNTAMVDDLRIDVRRSTSNLKSVTLITDALKRANLSNYMCSPSFFVAISFSRWYVAWIWSLLNMNKLSYQEEQRYKAVPTKHFPSFADLSLRLATICWHPRSFRHVTKQQTPPNTSQLHIQ